MQHLKGEDSTKEGNIEDYDEIYRTSLLQPEGEEIVITETNAWNEYQTDIIKLTDLMNGSLMQLVAYPQIYHDNIEHYKKVLTGYTFSIINLKNAPIDVATEVFTRLNVGGKALTLFEIMVAKTYHVFPPDPKEPDCESKTFDLAEKYQELTTELSASHFDTIPSATILQVIAILLEKDCTRKSILKLDKMRFINIWDEATECIKSSIDFFRSYGIAVGRILPYNALLVPFSYFFYIHKQNPTGDMKKRLEDYFWRSSLGFRYSSGVEGKLAQDIAKIDKIIAGELPKYEWVVNVNEEFVEAQGFFSTGKSFIKAILCLYAKQKPKSFDNNLDVIIDNSWLKIASSKNYHHFFPKSWLAKHNKDTDYVYVNHIVNITIVDDFLNKNTIKAQSPANYMKHFFKKNDELAETMKTHFIDIEKDGIWENDYNLFYDNRLKRITKALHKFIIPQEQSSENLEIYQDIEEQEEQES